MDHHQYANGFQEHVAVKHVIIHVQEHIKKPQHVQDYQNTNAEHIIMMTEPITIIVYGMEQHVFKAKNVEKYVMVDQALQIVQPYQL